MEVQNRIPKTNPKKKCNFSVFKNAKMYTFVHYFKLQTSISIQSKDFPKTFTLQSCVLLTFATVPNLLHP